MKIRQLTNTSQMLLFRKNISNIRRELKAFMKAGLRQAMTFIESFDSLIMVIFWKSEKDLFRIVPHGAKIITTPDTGNAVQSKSPG